MSKRFFILACLLVLTTLGQAEEETRFDSIVKELKSSLHEDARPPSHRDGLEEVQMEFGGSLIGNYVAVGENGAPSGGALMKGFDLHFGIELLSPSWLAEVGFRSFGSERMTNDYSASLQEYELDFIHKFDLQAKMQLRAGIGISAKFMQTNDTRSGQSVGGRDQAPALVALLGLDHKLSPRVSVGPAISYRSPLVDETIERPTIDASIRLDFYF